MRITIRIDDVTPTMDFHKFERFKKLLDRHEIKPLIGVIPDCKDKKLYIDEPKADFWDYVRSLQQSGWTVAMHGYNHLYTTKSAGIFPISNKSEFAGLSLYKQDEMLREGKRILKSNGIITDIFMAPSHSFDNDTIKALKKNGFYRITDGFGKEPYRKNGMIYYPISVSRTKTLTDDADGLVTFVYHTNSMDDGDFDKFEQLFDLTEVVSFSEYTRMDIKGRTLADDGIEYMTARAKYMAVQLRKKTAR